MGWQSNRSICPYPSPLSPLPVTWPLATFFPLPSLPLTKKNKQTNKDDSCNFDQEHTMHPFAKITPALQANHFQKDL